MDLIYWYILFAVTTTATSLYELYVPVMQVLEARDGNSNVIEYRWITYFVFITFTFTLAPVMLLPCIIPNFGERFRIALIKSLS